MKNDRAWKMQEEHGRLQGPGVELCPYTTDDNLVTWIHLPEGRLGHSVFLRAKEKIFNEIW